MDLHGPGTIVTFIGEFDTCIVEFDASVRVKTDSLYSGPQYVNST
jgi:hypothetical protein